MTETTVDNALILLIATVEIFVVLTLLGGLWELINYLRER